MRSVVREIDDQLMTVLLARYDYVSKAGRNQPYRYFMNLDEYREALLAAKEVAVMLDEQSQPLAVLHYARTPLGAGCYNPEFFVREGRRLTDAAFIPVGGFVSFAAQEQPQPSVLEMLALAGLTRAVIAHPNGQTHLFSNNAPRIELDSMVLVSFKVKDARKHSVKIAVDLTIEVARSLSEASGNELWNLLQVIFAEQSLVGSPCPQLPAPEEYALFLSDEQVLKALMRRNGKLVASVILVPTRLISFLEASFSTKIDYFVYDVAVSTSERNRFTSPHLLDLILDHLDASARVSFDYSVRLNRLLPGFVQYVLGLQRAHLVEEDRMIYSLIGL